MNTLRSKIKNRLILIAFEQIDAQVRLRYLRISIAIVWWILLVFGPYDNYYVHTAPWLSSILGEWAAVIHTPLRWVCVIFLIPWMLKRGGRIVDVTCLLLLLGFNAHIMFYAPKSFNYNTHLHWFMFTLIFSRTHKKNIGRVDSNSFLLSFCQVFVGLIYFQAGLSKLVNSGLYWAKGDTIEIYSAILRSGIGREVLNIPYASFVFGISTIVLELGFLPALFIFWRYRAVLATIMIIFHIGIYIVIGISFWPLWILFFALFFPCINSKRSGQNQERRAGG